MKSVKSTALSSSLLGGLQLLGLGVSPADPTLLAPQLGRLETAPAGAGTRTLAVTERSLREAEAAHLEVYASCKAGRFAFDPAVTGPEALSREVQAIYQSLA